MNNFSQVAGNMVSGLLIFTVVVVVIFLVFREFFCWYWKINQNVALLREIRDQLAAKVNSQSTVAPTGKQGTLADASTGKFCSACGAPVVDARSAFCAECGAKF